MNNELIRVNEQDEILGTIEKMEAHRSGILHRAFSVFLFAPDGRWLLQQRALSKYHSAGLWSNACCGHPLAGEYIGDAARNRLRFEMGLSCEMEEVFSFVYRADLDKGMTEHEYDHVFFGVTGNTPQPNPSEVAAWRFFTPMEIQEGNWNFTAWFKLIAERVQEIYNQAWRP